MSISVVIGAASSASSDAFSGDYCVISANWGFEPGKSDAFCLGSWLPSEQHIVYKPQQTLSLTIYAPGSNVYILDTSEECEVASTINASVNAQTCDGGEVIDGEWHLTSYSYSKESKDQAGQETWSFTKWLGVSSLISTTGSMVIEPTWILRQIAQGQASGYDYGMQFSSEFANAKSGSVSAGGLGKANTVTHGLVSSVGGGGITAGSLGNASASIPYTPLYI